MAQILVHLVFICQLGFVTTVVQLSDTCVLPLSASLCVQKSIQYQDCHLPQSLETRIMGFNKIICSAICRQKHYRWLNVLDEVWQRDTKAAENDPVSMVLWLLTDQHHHDTEMVTTLVTFTINSYGITLNKGVNTMCNNHVLSCMWVASFMCCTTLWASSPVNQWTLVSQGSPK